MKPSGSCNARFRLWASHFSCFAKKSNQKKATPTIGPILRCSEKSGTKKTRYAQTVFRSDRFFLPLLGANQRGPVEPVFDRFAIRATRARMQELTSQPGKECLIDVYLFDHFLSH